MIPLPTKDKKTIQDLVFKSGGTSPIYIPMSRNVIGNGVDKKAYSEPQRWPPVDTRNVRNFEEENSKQSCIIM
jgi:hypothetical protein